MLCKDLSEIEDDRLPFKIFPAPCFVYMDRSPTASVLDVTRHRTRLLYFWPDSVARSSTCRVVGLRTLLQLFIVYSFVSIESLSRLQTRSIKSSKTHYPKHWFKFSFIFTYARDSMAQWIAILLHERNIMDSVMAQHRLSAFLRFALISRHSTSPKTACLFSTSESSSPTPKDWKPVDMCGNRSRRYDSGAWARLRLILLRYYSFIKRVKQNRFLGHLRV